MHKAIYFNVVKMVWKKRPFTGFAIQYSNKKLLVMFENLKSGRLVSLYASEPEAAVYRENGLVSFKFNSQE